MNMLYNFAVGPLAWAAWGICLLGMMWRLWSLWRLARRRDASSIAYMTWGCALKSLFKWAMPFGALGWRTNPLLTAATFTLHLALLLAALFTSAHNVMWDYNFGVSLVSLPDGIMDVISILALAACGVLAWRRICDSNVNSVTRKADWTGLILVAGIFATGFASVHVWGSQPLMALLHVLFAEALLVCLPFTRLSHAFLIPFTRAYMGSEAIGVRKTCDW